MASKLASMTAAAAARLPPLNFKRQCVSPASTSELQQDQQSVEKVNNSKPEEKETKPVVPKLECAEKYIQARQYYLENKNAEIALIREDLAAFNKKPSSLLTNFREYANLLLELNAAKKQRARAQKDLEFVYPFYRELLQQEWMNSSKFNSAEYDSTESSFASCSTFEHESSIPSETYSQPDGEHYDNNNNDDVSMIDAPSEDVEQGENDISTSFYKETVEQVAATTENNNTIAEAIQTVSRPPSASVENPLVGVSPIEALVQRMTSMRSGIAPADEDSFIQPASNENSFLEQFNDDNDQKKQKTLAGRRPSTSSSSLTTSKECVSTVDVLTMALGNQSLRDPVSTMQSRWSAFINVDTNSDVSEEEWE